MNCQQCEKLASAYLEGELPPAEEQEIKAHVDRCQICQKRFKHLQEMIETLNNMSSLEAPPTAVAGVLRKVKQPSIAKIIHEMFKVKVPAFAYAVSIIIALLGGYWLGTQKMSVPAVPPIVESITTQQVEESSYSDFVDFCLSEYERKENKDVLVEEFL